VEVGVAGVLGTARRHADAAKLAANTAYHLRGMTHGQWAKVYGHPRLRVVSGHRRTLLCGWGKVTFGDRCFVNAGTILFSVLEVTIGNDVALANEVYILDSNSHGTEGRNPYDAPVRIGDGTWVGARAVILPGVTIGKRVVVAAGAVVSRDVPDDSIVAGNPGVVTRKLDYPAHCQRAWCDYFCACPERPRL
jgi:acetyltransferase-like isoleucine patch superfamily enzyme